MTRLIAAVAASLILVVGIGATALAGEDRVPSGKEPVLKHRSLPSLAPLAQASGGGVKKKIRKLQKQVKQLQRAYSAIVRDLVNCEKTANVTSYGGYDYLGVIGAASALDFTDPGDSVSARMLVYTC